MNKILISGYYGFNNLGDEAILETVIGRIRHTVDDVHIAVLSATPEKTARIYGVEAHNRKKIGSVLRAIWQCDILVSGGGSLLQDVTGKMSIKYYLAIILLAKLMGKRVMVYSQGIGPIEKEGNRWLTRIVLSHVDCITVREENSKIDLREIGLGGIAIGVTADPVIDLPAADPKIGLELLKQTGGQWNTDKPTIGFALRSKDFQTEVLYENLKRTIDGLMDSYQLAFIPFHYNEDLQILQRLQKDYGKDLLIVTERYNTAQSLSIIGCFDALVGVRLHSLIFAAVQNVLPIGISYDPKIDYFMETLGMHTTCQVSEISPEILNDALSKLLADQESQRASLKKVVEELKHKIDDNDRLLLNLLKRG